MDETTFQWGDSSTWSLSGFTAVVEETAQNISGTIAAGRTILSNPTPQGTQQPSTSSSSTFPNSLTSGLGLWLIVGAIALGLILLFKYKK